MAYTDHNLLSDPLDGEKEIMAVNRHSGEMSSGYGRVDSITQICSPTPSQVLLSHSSDPIPAENVSIDISFNVYLSIMLPLYCFLTNFLQLIGAAHMLLTQL